MKNILLTLLFLAFVIQLNAQNTIKGTLIDKKGEPIPGATVNIQGFAGVIE